VTVRVEIDLNVRIGRDLTYSGYEDIEGIDPAGLTRHTAVEAYERESGLHGPATVAGVDRERRLVYLSIDWSQLHLDGSEEG
jgi:hypothetical protein